MHIHAEIIYLSDHPSGLLTEDEAKGGVSSKEAEDFSRTILEENKENFATKADVFPVSQSSCQLSRCRINSAVFGLNLDVKRVRVSWFTLNVVILPTAQGPKKLPVYDKLS